MPKKRTFQYNLYWGDMHSMFKRQWAKIPWEEFLDRSFRAARDYLDFFPIVYYPANYYTTKEGLRVESVGWRDEYQAEWELINAFVKKYHEPGRFVTFAGYEWSGDRTRWGDHNVFYFDDDQPLDLAMTVDELYANLRRHRAIAIPHHTAYMPGHRSKDWDHYDEGISPFAETYSIHGSSEGCDTPFGMTNNGSMAPRISGGTIQDGLARGYRLGIIASSDHSAGFPGRHGAGLVACYAKDLTRASLWEAFMARRVYGVTGDRMKLNFEINGHFMGEVFRAKGPVKVRADVVGTQAIDRIELIKNNRVVATHCHNGTWDAPKRGKARIKLQVEHGWGPVAHYGLKVSEKVWNGSLKTREAKILSVEGCFTRQGQRISRRSDAHCVYQLTTSPRTAAAVGDCQQSIVFEIEGALDAKVKLTCEEISETFTLRELLASSRCLVMRKQVETNIKQQFGLSPEQVENPDVFYHNAYKIKLHKAAPEAGYTASLKFTDSQPKRGRDFYYIRVSQLNGHYAWSSPIWVEA
jgi:hypothetical protein